MPQRRTVLKTLAGAGLLSVASPRRVLGANDRVRVGLIGNGLIGKRHLLDFKAQPDVEIVGVSELSDARLEEAASLAGSGAARYKDFRKLLDRPDVDAVVVSTPDHWHALMTILACAAGKDVYVEKPLTHVVREGEWMMQAAARNRRVVQVGTQQRSGRHYQRCVELIRGGHLGEVRRVRMGAHRNILPGFSKPVGDPLSAQDWDMWLGPAPHVPYDPGRGLYHFRWFWDYSGGQATNLLAHEIDIVQWALDANPQRVSAMGSRYSLQGIGETPDVFEALIEYPGFLASWSNREAAAGTDGGLHFHGTKGMLRLNRAGFEVVPDPATSPEDQIPRFTEARPSGAAGLRTTPLKEEGFEQVRDQFVPHVRNFLDCVKSRGTPNSNLADGHRTAVPCHLANIAMKVGRVLRWDAEKQDVVGDAEASKLLTKEYRSPWDRELKGRSVVGEDRRTFLRAMTGAALGAAAARARGIAPAARAAKGAYAIAYTSFAVRLQRGRDLTRATGAPGLSAEAFVDLCRTFGADGCQLDLSQLGSTEPAYLDGLKRRLGEAGLFVELSVPGKALEDAQVFTDVVTVARRLGAPRLRIALLSGRRYETFPTRDSWREFAAHWRQVLVGSKAAFDRHRLPVGVENHKDWSADELVDLIRSVGSPFLGACVDFGNNLSLLEDPLDTVTKLAPYAVTTHLKDMAVRPYEHGFELSEVPLGTGICPLAKMIEVLRAARPDVPLCLEMITRDPLKVPCFDEAYWVTYDKRDAARLEAFQAGVLSKASASALPRISGAGYEAMVAAEDENVRRSTAFARQTLRL